MSCHQEDLVELATELHTPVLEASHRSFVDPPDFDHKLSRCGADLQQLTLQLASEEASSWYSSLLFEPHTVFQSEHALGDVLQKKQVRF